jgi:1-acyl-sn-glycerol-3-phosphate acyltransferase
VSRRQSGFGAAIRDFSGALLPLSVRDLERRIDDRLRKIPTELNEYGFDRFGMSPESARRAALPAALLYRYYFRVETHGIEHVPAGRVLLVANHAGQLPFDGAMLGTAMLLEAHPPRIVRAMGEFWIPSIPFFNLAASRTGTLVGTPENCVAALEAGECVMVFPEGVRGMNKPFRERYALQRFGLGFMRLALETDTPILPVGIVGSEEQQPGLANLSGLGRLLGMPAFPLTLGFPWLGPLGILPLPVKYHLHFGEPLHFSGSPTDEDAAIEARVAEVKQAIADLLAQGRATRRGIFRG